MLEKELERIIYNLKRIYYYHHNDNGSLDIVHDLDDKSIKFYSEGDYAFRYFGEGVGGEGVLDKVHSEIKRNFPDLSIRVLIKESMLYDMSWKFEKPWK